MSNSFVGTRPEFYDSQPDIIHENCMDARFTSYNSEMYDSLLNITAVYVNVRLEGGTVSSGNQSRKGAFGITVQPGFYFRAIESSGAKRRRRRSVDPVQVPRNPGHHDDVRISLTSNPRFLGVLLGKTKGRAKTSSRLVHRLIQRVLAEDRDGYDKESRINEFDQFVRTGKSRHRRGADDSGGSSVENSLIMIRQLTISHIQNEQTIGNAAIRIVTKTNFDIQILGCQFLNNSRALNVDFIGGNIGVVFIDTTNFTDNVAHGPGGGVNVFQMSGDLTLEILNCIFTNNTALSLEQISYDDDEITTEVSKIIGSGGAVSVNVVAGTSSSCHSNIGKSTFHQNTAESYGGSIYLTPGAFANLFENEFTNVNGEGLRPRIGDVLECRGNVQMTSNLFNINSAQDEIPIVSYRADSDGSFLESRELFFICPAGFSAVPLYSSIKLTPTRDAIESLLMYCKACNDGEYTLQLSEVQVDQTQITQIANASCLECPYGGTCSIDVRAKANFWGVVHNAEMFMYLCPEGYCCQDEVCDTYDICAENREGTLCGKCLDGYSESLFSTECIDDNECSYASLFWAVIGFYGLLYVLLFVMEPEIGLVTKSFSEVILQKWADYKARREARRQAEMAKRAKAEMLQKTDPEVAKEEEEEEEEGEGAYLSIFMYYFQIPSLITIDILYIGNRDKPLVSITNSIANIFSFNTFGLGMNTCLFKGVTAIFKTYILTVYVLYLFVSLFIWVGIAALVNCMAGKKLLKKPWIANITMRGRFLGTLVNLLMYTYQYFAENTFNMVRCIDVASEADPVLYIDANISCYQPWQYALIGFGCIYVCPFFLVLLYGPSLLNRRLISLKTFLISMLLPLFGFPVLIYKFYRYRGEEARAKHKEERVNGKGEILDGSVTSVVGILFDPYRSDLGGGICWEGIIALRRLTLVILASLVQNVLLRHIGITIVCLVSLLMHLRIQPFIKSVCNVLESSSLAIILFISIMNLVKATYFEAGNIPTNVADRVFFFYDWIEAFFLGFIPMIIGGFIGVALIVTLGIYIQSKCCSRRPRTATPKPSRFQQHSKLPYGHPNQRGFKSPEIRQVGYGMPPTGNGMPGRPTGPHVHVASLDETNDSRFPRLRHQDPDPRTDGEPELHFSNPNFRLNKQLEPQLSRNKSPVRKPSKVKSPERKPSKVKSPRERPLVKDEPYPKSIHLPRFFRRNSRSPNRRQKSQDKRSRSADQNTGFDFFFMNERDNNQKPSVERPQSDVNLRQRVPYTGPTHLDSDMRTQSLDRNLQHDRHHRPEGERPWTDIRKPRTPHGFNPLPNGDTPNGGIHHGRHPNTNNHNNNHSHSQVRNKKSRKSKKPKTKSDMKHRRPTPPLSRHRGSLSDPESVFGGAIITRSNMNLGAPFAGKLHASGIRRNQFGQPQHMPAQAQQGVTSSSVWMRPKSDIDYLEPDYDWSTETEMLSLWRNFRHWHLTNFHGSQWRKFRQNDIFVSESGVCITDKIHIKIQVS